MHTKDVATTTDLTSAIEALLPALEQFLQFDQPEQTVQQRATWSAQLDEPLPQTGAGAEAVLALLRDIVIPHGLRIGASGFSGFATCLPNYGTGQTIKPQKPSMILIAQYFD
jgi:aromatic-L-amino-acid/L-tryptophan decarboxylase